MVEDPVIIPARLDDLPDLARIHFEALPDDFLPSLGLAFLEQVYYPAALRSEYAVTLLAKADRRTSGFVTVAHDSNRFTREVLRGQWIRMAFYALRTILRKPFFLVRSLEIIHNTLLSEPDPLPGEIVFIAVEPGAQHRGLGRAMVSASLEYLHTQGVRSCRTKTLATNQHVIAMYEKIGWRVRDHFNLIGRTYVTLVVDEKEPGHADAV